MHNFWSGGQYSLFRILFGSYLFIHFTHLLPWGKEIFSNQGIIKNAESSPLFNIIPNVLGISDSPVMIALLIVTGLLSSIFFLIGKSDKIAAGIILYILICLFAKNPLIANPALPYVGFMLLMHLFIPSAPYFSFDNKKDLTLGSKWKMPAHIYISGVIVLALTYSYSGYTKLLSPSWVSGDTIAFVLENPLARDYFLNDFLLSLPPIFLKLLTWFILYVELIYAPLALIKGAHKYLWLGMLIVQFGFLFLLNFADLTIAMLLFHLITFNPKWIKNIKKTTGAQKKNSQTVYYDGECGFCHSFIKFLLAEDTNKSFNFSPLESEHFIKSIDAETRFKLPISLILVNENGEVKTKSTAVAEILKNLDGLWFLLGIGLLIIPRPIRDLGYDLIGSVRKKILPTPNTLCPILPPELSKRFI